jgi:hypothetical protein
MEGFRKGTNFEQIWLRSVREAQELSYQGLSEVNAEVEPRPSSALGITT